MKNLLFVLGGEDLEMAAIRQLLVMVGARWLQPKKDWGDHQYNPADLGLVVKPMEVRPTGAGAGGQRYYDHPAHVVSLDRVVFVECRPAEGWPEKTKIDVIDHHGDRSGESASILQILRIAKVPISGYLRRWIELVAANDSGYIPAMRALGATPEEIERIRALDRECQGVTPWHEDEAKRAIREAKTKGRLTVIRMDHRKTAPVADRLFGQADQLLVFSGDKEVNFFGDGAICSALREEFTGWSGGAGLGKAGESAFWGLAPDRPLDKKAVEEFISSRLA